ncbi:MAG: glycosyltransferase [Methanosarcina sp.]|nr:glycosyltransferase [Methanosarcina sp.]MDD4522475.1 glycosyltransferase [Methanosarcina sp.]
MIKVLMCGPLSIAGGVSVHTKNISKALSNEGIEIFLYDTSCKYKDLALGCDILKIYNRTFGLIFNAIKLRHEYDVLHVQASGGIFSFISALSGTFVSKLCDKRLFVTFHYRASKKFLLKYRQILAYVLKNSTGFFVVSEKQKELIQEILLLSDNIRVIPNGFDKSQFYKSDKFACRRELGLPTNRKILLSIGNLIEEKGHKYLIEAIKEVLKYRQDIFCVIVGKGRLKEKLNAQIKDENLEQYFELVGVKPHEEIPKWINACDIVVVPSIVESFGIVQIEAMACGKPVVATYNGGSENILISEDYGILCKSADSHDLAKNIVAALNIKFDEDTIIHYSRSFSWDVISREILNAYKKV